MSIGALVTVIVMWAFAALLAFKEKPKLGWALLPTFIGAIALLIAIPALLLKGTVVPQAVAWAFIGLGLALTFATVAFEKMPNLLMFLGATIAVWALFRAFPHVDNAFFNFGKNMSGSIDNLWEAAKGTGSAFAGLLKDLIP